MKQYMKEPEAPPITNPCKAIRAYCLGCGEGTAHDVRNCVITRCPLYPYRLGKNPYRPRREYTAEERAAMAERFKKRVLSENVPSTMGDQPS